MLELQMILYLPVAKPHNFHNLKDLHDLAPAASLTSSPTIPPLLTLHQAAWPPKYSNVLPPQFICMVSSLCLEHFYPHYFCMACFLTAFSSLLKFLLIREGFLHKIGYQ